MAFVDGKASRLWHFLTDRITNLSTQAARFDDEIDAIYGAINDLAGDVINVRRFGAVGDCTAADTGTDDSSAFQAAIDAWIKAGDGATLIVPRGRYRIASALTADMNANQGCSLVMEGHITPDTTLNGAFTVHNGIDVDLKLKVWGGGTLGDLSAATPASGGTECFVVRALRGAKIDVRGWSYAGRVLRVRRQQSGELKTSMLDIHMTSGDVISGHSRCGQSIYADDDGIGDAQGGWGKFSGTLFWDQYGPTFEDLNDLHIGEIEGSFRLQTMELRGCIGVNAGLIYIGDTGAASGGNDCDTLVIKKSSTAAARSWQRIVLTQLRCLKGRRGLTVSGGATTSPGLVVGSIQANDMTEAAVYLDSTWWVNIGPINALSCGQTLHITGPAREIVVNGLMYRGSAVTDDVVFLSEDIDRVTLRDVHIEDGASTKALIRHGGTGNVFIDNAWLRGSTVAELIHIVSTVAGNGLHLRGGLLSPSGSTTAFNSTHKAETIRDVVGHDDQSA